MKGNNIPLVSVIMPVFNRQLFLLETIKSIRKQTYENWELIAVDDGSTDDSLKALKEFSKKDNRIKTFSRPETLNKGANACRNYGFEKAEGVYVNWFDSDDFMLPNFIQEKVEAFDENGNVDLVLSKTVRVYPDGKRVFEKRTNLTKSLLEDYITADVSWYLPDGMFKKSCLDSYLLFDENVMAGQDRDFYIRNIIRCKVVILNKYLTEYYCHQASISHSLYRTNNYKLQLSVLENLMNQVDFLKEKELLSKRLKKHYFIEIKNKLPSVMKCNSLKKEYFLILYELSEGEKTN